VAEPACLLGELVVSKPGGGWLGLAVRVWGGFDSGRSFLAPRFNRLWEGCSRSGSTGLGVEVGWADLRASASGSCRNHFVGVRGLVVLPVRPSGHGFATVCPSRLASVNLPAL